MATHRYWRVFCRRNSGNASFTGVTEIEMATSAAGSDVTSTSFAIGSGSYQAGTATDAFDNDFTGDVLQWNGTGNGVWVGQDFGAGNEKDIVEVRIRPNKDAANRTFGVFDVQHSDDGTNYTTAWSVFYTSWSVGTTVTFSQPTAAAHRYWRVRASAQIGSGLGGTSIAEVEMATSYEGSDECTGGTAFSRSNFDGTTVAANAFDNSTSTLYADGSGGSNIIAEWIGYDFGSGVTKDIVEVRMLPRNDGIYWAQAPYTGMVESSPDGVNYISRWTFTEHPAMYQYKMQSVKPGSAPTRSAHRYWGIRANSVQGTSGSPSGTYFGVREIEFRATVGGADTATGGQGLTYKPIITTDTTALPAPFDNATSEASGPTGAVGSSGTIFLYDFGSGVTKSVFAEIAITARAAGSFTLNNQAPTDFDLLWSDDCVTWTVQQNFTSPATWTSAEQRLFGATVSTRRRQIMVGSC